MSKFLDFTGLTQLVNKLNALFDKKVDKVAGKGLSANDFTDAYKNKLEGIAEGANKYTHPNSGVTAGTYRSVTVNKQGHITEGTNPTTLDGYGITEVDASKITGTINIENLPHGALERCVVVADDEARFKLTSDNIQTGDTVKVKSTEVMYFVKDDTKLSSEEGYEIYTAGSATSATSDSKGQNITETYIKKISIETNSDNIEIRSTYGGGSIDTVTVPEFNTTTNGLVPAPLISASTEFLRADGIWGAPSILYDSNTPILDVMTSDTNYETVVGIWERDIIGTGYVGEKQKDTWRIDKDGNATFSSTVANSFIGNLQGNATSASSVPWSGVTGKPDFALKNHTHDYLPLDGGTIAGDINMDGNQIDMNNGEIHNAILYAENIYGVNGNNIVVNNHVDMNNNELFNIDTLTMSGGDITTNGGDINLTGNESSNGSLYGANEISANKFIGNLTGNADTATKLVTPRSINGTQFDGTTNITTANWGTSRNITIGNNTKTVNGSANVTWTLDEIGAASENHNHNDTYLKLSGGTITGQLNIDNGHLIVDSGDIYTMTGGLKINGESEINANLKIFGQLNIAGGDINTNGRDINLGDDGNINGANTITANSFVGSLTGNATSASSVPWSGVTGIEYATEEDILALFD